MDCEPVGLGLRVPAGHVSALLSLAELITEATMLAGYGHPCHAGHAWETAGGRSCPRGGENSSQAVYRCVRCGEWDYGEPGGPGHADCARPCHWTCERAEQQDIEDRTNELMGALL